MTNNQWNHHYFESISAELPTNIFRSLEIEQYFQKTLKDNGFSLQNYKINFSKSVINIMFSVCKLKQPKLKIKLSNEPTEKISKHINKRKSLKNMAIKKKYLQTAAFCKNSRLKIETERLKNIEFTNISNKIAKSLKLFTKNKQNINITIKEMNFVNSNSNVKLVLENLYKFRRAFFFKTGKRIITPFITQKSSAKLIGRFTAEQLVAVKQQNFFFNFLQESLLLLVNQKFSKLQGIKILITGRINNSARSRTRKIEIGNVSLISKSSKIDYSESTAFTPNGTIGIKVWVSEK
nr:ribosomal protein S3 [Navicula sp.]